jgi:N6-adenosine-specific RNA methylase IME4
MTLEFDPRADLFPLIEGAEFAALVADVKANGVRDPIWMFEGRILDGRNRYRAAVAAGIQLPVDRFLDFQSDLHGDPLGFVISKNLTRRHLNESQRAMVAAKIANLEQGRPADEKPANLPVSQPAAAVMLNVSERSVRSAKAVQEKGTPSLVHAVEQGKLAVSEAAKAARLTPVEQERVAHLASEGKPNVVRTVIKQEVRAAREADLGKRQAEGNLALPAKLYGVILADPQWGRTTYSRLTGLDRHASNHYPVATGDEATQDDAIKGLGVPSIAAEDCVLGLWCTDPHRGVDVLRTWGFEPKAYFVWVKDILVHDTSGAGAGVGMLRSGQHLEVVGAAGLGFWNRDRCELLLIGVRGHPVCPPPGLQGERVWFARRGEHATRRDEIHSDKPDCSFEWFERHWPTTPKIELNARRRRPGWSSWGNEVPEESPTLQPKTPEPAEAAGHSAPVDDGLTIPAFLRRTAPPDASSPVR